MPGIRPRPQHDFRAGTTCRVPSKDCLCAAVGEPDSPRDRACQWCQRCIYCVLDLELCDSRKAPREQSASGVGELAGSGAALRKGEPEHSELTPLQGAVA